MQILKIITLFLLASSAGADSKCQHEQGVYCPHVEAPRVTGLKEGSVHVQYLVQPNGSVSDITVIESTGDPRWVESVKGKVKTWKYRESNKPYQQDFKFKAVFSE